MGMLWEGFQDVQFVLELSKIFYYYSPSYDKYKGVYICAGYKEGDNFIKCDSTFARDELERQPWDSNFEQR